MKSGCKYLLTTLVALLEGGFVLIGFFLLGCLVVVLGIASYLWLGEPKRLAMIKGPDPESWTIIEPQPLQVSPAAPGVVMMDPDAMAFISGSATNAAVWVNGESFQSGGRAAWELIRSAWQLWILSPGTLISLQILKRYRRKLENSSLERKQGQAIGG